MRRNREGGLFFFTLVTHRYWHSGPWIGRGRHFTAPFEREEIRQIRTGHRSCTGTSLLALNKAGSRPSLLLHLT